MLRPCKCTRLEQWPAAKHASAMLAKPKPCCDDRLNPGPALKIKSMRAYWAPDDAATGTTIVDGRFAER